eukprot:TRINITY_DN31203_c0_g1_i11.p9 TRINITY_DN31203_c0_g1~~TRINITY_DN31203_c0_g1_i11.p9  ORF type:complete len:116 (-),score=2.88 TRINITY_DN31203_c0_g1_i11:616-963(-)
MQTKNSQGFTTCQLQIVEQNLGRLIFVEFGYYEVDSKSIIKLLQTMFVIRTVQSQILRIHFSRLFLFVQGLDWIQQGKKQTGYIPFFLQFSLVLNYWYTLQNRWLLFVDGKDGKV